MSVPREVELKIDLDLSSLKILRKVSLAPIASEEITREKLTSVYFDTKKLSVHRKGLSLRIRQEGKRSIQTLKGRQEGRGRALRPPGMEHGRCGRQP